MICCCKSELSPGTRTTSVCILIGPWFPPSASELRRRLFWGVFPVVVVPFPDWLESPAPAASSLRPAEAAKRWRLLVTTSLLLVLTLPPLPPLASSPSDDHSFSLILNFLNKPGIRSKNFRNYNFLRIID